MATTLRRGGRADHRAVDAPGRREHRYVPPRSPRTRTLTARRARTHTDGAQKWLATLGTGFLSALAHWIVGLFFTLPTLASIVAFITYSGTGHDLNAAVLFSSLSLFQIVQTPLTLLREMFSRLVYDCIAHAPCRSCGHGFSRRCEQRP